MKKDLTISTTMPNGFRIPGVISGMRVFLSSDNHIGVTSGRFVSAEGELIEVPRVVGDVAPLPDKDDIVMLTVSCRDGGVCFRVKKLSIVDIDEIVVAMVKILKSPALGRCDLSITHALSSSNFSSMKVLSFTASVDGESDTFDLPLRVSDFHDIEVRLGAVKKEVGADYTIKNFTNLEGYRYTSIIFNNPPKGPHKVHVNINIKDSKND